MIAHRSPISGVACWQDRYVATAGYDNQVILWDAATGRALHRVYHDHLANQCAFSPDGRWLVTASSDYTARLWSLPDLRLRAVLDGHEDDVEMATFHPTEPLVATASRDHKVRVYGLDGELVARLEGHEADVISVEWTDVADELVSSSDDGTIRRWSVKAQRVVDVIDMNGVETDTVALGPDGTIYAGNDSGEIVVVAGDGVAGNGRGTSTIPAHDAGIKRLVLEAGRGLLVSLSYDRTARLWRTVAGGLEPLTTTRLPDDVWPRSCAFGPGTTLVFGSFGARYRVLDYETGEWDAPAPPTGGLNAVAAVPVLSTTLGIGDAGEVHDVDVAAGTRTRRVSVGSLCNFLTPTSGPVLTGGQLGRVFDAVSGDLVHQHRSPLNCGARFVTGEGEFVILGSYTGEALLLRVEDGTARYVRDVPLLANAVKGIAAGASTIFAVCADRSAAWLDMATLEPIRVLADAHDRIANGCAALDGDRFVSVSRDLHVRLWDSDGNAEALRSPHDHSIKCVAASSDGAVVATGSYDGTLALLDVAGRSWSPVQRPTTSGISSLGYDEADGVFLASSYDGNVYVLRP